MEENGFLPSNKYSVECKEHSPYKFRRGLNNKAIEYVNTFSIHAFTRLFRGSWIERIFWVIILITCVTAASFGVYTLSQEYLEYSVRREVTTVVTNENRFPSVTYCLERAKTEQHCNIDVNEEIPFQINPDRPCSRTLLEKPKVQERILVGSMEKFWTNSVFKFSCVSMHKCHYDDIKAEYFRTDGDCVTWNPNGTYYNKMNELELELILRQRSFSLTYQNIKVIVHEANIAFANEPNTLRMSTQHNYDITIDKQVIRKSPRSRCAQGRSGHIFPGAYTLNNCYVSALCVEALKRCGATFDHCDANIPHAIARRYATNHTLKHAMLCLRSVTAGSNCEVPCEQEKYDVTVASYSTALERNQLTILLRHKQRNVYTVTEEKVVYGLTRFIANTGGLVSLIFGGLVFSVVEIIIYLCLSCM